MSKKNTNKADQYKTGRTATRILDVPPPKAVAEDKSATPYCQTHRLDPNRGKMQVLTKITKKS